MYKKERIGCGPKFNITSFVPCHTCDYINNPELCKGYRAKNGYIELYGVAT